MELPMPEPLAPSILTMAYIRVPRFSKRSI
jgi:hypothetical protein